MTEDVVTNNSAFTEKYLKKNYKLNLIKTVVLGSIITFFLIQSLITILEDKYPDDHIAIINVQGSISAGNPEGGGLKLSAALKKAFKSQQAKVILLMMNSGGGSPVQAEMVFETIQAYKTKYKKPVVVSMGDICASACYYIASAADNIYVHKATVTGSIGVRIDTWGLTTISNTLGVEKRTLTTGKHKAILDPFKDLTEEDKQLLRQNALTPMFNSFVSAVKQGRSSKLMSGQDAKIFSGMFWTGKQAIELGLVDAIKPTPLVLDALKEEYNLEETKRYNGSRISLSRMLSASLNEFISSLRLQSFY